MAHESTTGSSDRPLRRDLDPIALYELSCKLLKRGYIGNYTGLGFRV